VKKVAAVPDNLDELHAQLGQLQQRYPGAVLQRYLSFVPNIDRDAWVAPTASIIGQVTLAAEVSIWPGCVLRGDINQIEIRERTNLQDGTIVHLGDLDGTFLAEEIVVGHRAVLHGCRIGGGSLIGIQSTILDGARIGEGSIVGSGALVVAGMNVPPRSLVLGVPGQVVKTLTSTEENAHRRLALKYTRLAYNYRYG